MNISNTLRIGFSALVLATSLVTFTVPSSAQDKGSGTGGSPLPAPSMVC